LILLIAVFALVAFLFVGFAGAILPHIQAVEQVVHDIAKAALIVEHAFEPIEIAAGALLDQRPPQLDKLARGHWRRLPGEALAHQHRQCVFDRGVGAIADFVKFAAMEAVVEHGGEIFRDPAHATRANRFDPCLFDGFEYGARLLAAGRQLAMHRRVMAGEPQRDRVGMTANDCSLALVQSPRRLRQTRLAADEPGPL
jgi:hypothetical protein